MEHEFEDLACEKCKKGFHDLQPKSVFEELFEGVVSTDVIRKACARLVGWQGRAVTPPCWDNSGENARRETSDFPQEFRAWDEVNMRSK